MKQLNTSLKPTPSIGRFTAPDETGRRFGRLVALSRVNQTGAARWLCRCDCGVEKAIGAHNLRNGATRSCGCLQREQASERYTKAGNASLWNTCVSIYRVGARNRGLAWTISADQAIEIMKQDCTYCGAPPTNIKRHQSRNAEIAYNGIDRVDNAEGYVLSNLAPACPTCNLAKRTMSVAAFLEWVRRVAAHNPEPT